MRQNLRMPWNVRLKTIPHWRWWRSRRMSTGSLPKYRTSINNSSPDDYSDYDFSPPDTGESLYDSLLRQLSERDIPEKVRQAATYVIGNLDSNGYLHRTIPAIVNDMAFGPASTSRRMTPGVHSTL